MSKFLSILKFILKCLGVFFLNFLLCFIITFSITNILFKFNLITSYISLILAFFISILFAVIILISYIVKLTKKEKNFFPKFNWIKYYILFLIFIGLVSSIKTTLEMSLDDAKSLLSIEWTLFSILLALLVTWCVIVEKNIKTCNIDDKELHGVAKRLDVKLNQYKCQLNATGYLWNIIPSIIALTFLSSITYQILINQQLDLLIQTVLYFNLYIIINSIVLIILDIVSPTIVNLFCQKKSKLTNNVIMEELLTGTIEDVLEETIKLELEKHSETKLISLEEKENLCEKIFKESKPEIDKIKNKINKTKQTKF